MNDNLKSNGAHEGDLTPLLKPRDVAGERVDLKIDQVPFSRLPPGRDLFCMRDNIHTKPHAIHFIYGKRRAVQRDGPFWGNKTRKIIESAGFPM